MGKIVEIDPRGKKNVEVTKALFNNICIGIEGIDSRVAGYAFVAWNEAGDVAISSRAGGVISETVLPLFAYDKLKRMEEYRSDLVPKDLD